MTHSRVVAEMFGSALKTGFYFLGTIVTIPRTNDVLEVVDGQQRLATTAILLESLRLNWPMFHDLPLARVRLDNHYQLKDVSEMESNVPLDNGIGATRFIRFAAEVWDDEAYSTTQIDLTAFDSFGGECRATISASKLRRIPVKLDAKPATQI